MIAGSIANGVTECVNESGTIYVTTTSIERNLQKLKKKPDFFAFSLNSGNTFAPETGLRLVFSLYFCFCVYLFS